MRFSILPDSAEDADFRAAFRAWLDRELPPEFCFHGTRPPFAIVMDWHRRLYRGGYVAPHWPKIYGGAELPISQQMIVKEELALRGAPENMSQGLLHIGPLLIAAGNEAQKARHLPPILAGDIVWCQGYSEPNAGSDLTSLRTRAAVSDAGFVVTGQKIWTHSAAHAQWMFALVRTDPAAQRPADGISFILIELATPGITVRPIRTIAGDDELAEVFLDEVRVPRENLVGKLNDGWRVANLLLAVERSGGGSSHACLDALARLKLVARATGLDRDVAFRDRIALVEIDILAYLATVTHAGQLAAAGRTLGPEISILKITESETLQRTVDLLLEVAGAAGVTTGWIEADGKRLEVSNLWRQTRRASIYGGSNEIQRNIVARRVLDLPNWR